jgi:hypothetical protein
VNFKNVTESVPLQMTFENVPLTEEGKYYDIEVILTDNPESVDSLTLETIIPLSFGPPETAGFIVTQTEEDNSLEGVDSG